MFLNVWLIIWPNQKIVVGLAQGDAAVAGAKALLASRTNTLFSAPMLYGMLASKHGPAGGGYDGIGADAGLIICVLIILALEYNAVKGQVRPMASIVGVVHLSLALTAVLFLILHFL